MPLPSFPLPPLCTDSTHSPLPSLELVADVLQEPVQLNGVLPEYVPTEGGQALQPVGDVGVSMFQPLLLRVAQSLNDAIWWGEELAPEEGELSTGREQWRLCQKEANRDLWVESACGCIRKQAIYRRRVSGVS